MLKPEKSELQTMIESGIALLILSIIIIYFSFQLGVITLDEPAAPIGNITQPNETPTPEPTEAPVVIVTEDPIAYMLRTNGYNIRQWHQWFRADVQGINSQGTKDLHTLVTVYDYKFMDSYRWWSVSWARKFVVKPDSRDEQFLFVFINMYSDDAGDGRGDDVRQYGMGCDHFSAQVDERVYQAEWIEYPERRITEFDNLYTFDHVTTPGPYGFKIVQEKGSGVISAQQLEWLMGGRSNSWDGWCAFQLPRQDSQGNPVNATNTKILGNFGNLGGTVWWKLETQPLLSNSVT